MAYQNELCSGDNEEYRLDISNMVLHAMKCAVSIVLVSVAEYRFTSNLTHWYPGTISPHLLQCPQVVPILSEMLFTLVPNRMWFDSDMGR